MDYRPDMELEDMYLVGDFGVARRDGRPQSPDNMTLIAPPAKLNNGSWWAKAWTSTVGRSATR